MAARMLPRAHSGIGRVKKSISYPPLFSRELTASEFKPDARKNARRTGNSRMLIKDFMRLIVQLCCYRPMNL
jgi:hypothetical protein